MYYSNCGKPLNEDANFCAFCGQKVVIPTEIMQGETPPTIQNEPNVNGEVQKQNADIQPKKKREPLSAGRICLGLLGCVLITAGLTSWLGIIGAFISFIFVLLPFIVFTAVYNATIK